MFWKRFKDTKLLWGGSGIWNLLCLPQRIYKFLARSFTLKLKSQSLKALLFEKGSKIIKFIPFLGFKPNSWGLSLELLFRLMSERQTLLPSPTSCSLSAAWPTHGCNLSSYSVSFPDSFMFFLCSPTSWTSWEKRDLEIFVEVSTFPVPPVTL